MKIFIDNLSYNVTEGDLRQAFEVFGQVVYATVIMMNKVIVQKDLHSWKCLFKPRLSLPSKF